MSDPGYKKASEPANKRKTREARSSAINSIRRLIKISLKSAWAKVRTKVSQAIGINTLPTSEILCQKMKDGNVEDRRTRLFPSSIIANAAIPEAKIRCEVPW